VFAIVNVSCYMLSLLSLPLVTQSPLEQGFIFVVFFGVWFAFFDNSFFGGFGLA